MRALLGATLSFGLLLAATGAFALPAAGVGGSCPYPSASADGCSGAVPAGRQFPDFFTTAPQLGQTYQTASFTGSVNGTTLTVSGVIGAINPNRHIDTLQGPGIPAGVTIVSGDDTRWTLSRNLGVLPARSMTALFRPDWNVAGVDYPVGVPLGTVLTDPATLPTCSGAAHPLCLNPTYRHIVMITAPNSGSDVVISGYDFTLHGSYSIMLAAATTIPGDLTIENSKFTFGANFQPGGDVFSLANSQTAAYQPWNPYSNSIIKGNISVLHNDLDMGANTGSVTINQPQGGQVMFLIPGGAASSVTFEYNYLANMNNRLTTGWGATLKYNFFRNNNYNTSNHGEFTAFNQMCSAKNVGCSTPVLIDYDYNTEWEENTYCGGMTAPIFAGNGLNSPQITDVTAKNNVFIDNGCALKLTGAGNTSPGRRCLGTENNGACQITFETIDGGAGQLGDGFALCEATSTRRLRTCRGGLQAQISGTRAGSGIYHYSGTINRKSGYLWVQLISPGPSVYLTGETYRNIDSENNYVDPTGVQFVPYTGAGLGCGVTTTRGIPHFPSGALISSGNWLMAPSNQYLGFTPCDKE